MFNLIINWLKVINENLPVEDRVPNVIDWIKVLVSPFVSIYDEFIRRYAIFKLKIAYTGQVMSIEKTLNDKYSPTLGGIYITNGISASKYYLYNKIEGKTPRYLYFNWQHTTPYIAGKFAVSQNKVWKCLMPNTNSMPSPSNPNWVFHKDIEFLYTNAEFNLVYNFIVKVPSTLTVNLNEMRALIDYYRLAGMRYKIELY